MSAGPLLLRYRSEGSPLPGRLCPPGLPNTLRYWPPPPGVPVDRAAVLAVPPGEQVAAGPTRVRAPRASPPTSPRRSESVTEPTQGVSSVNTPGVGGDVVGEGVVGEGVVGEVEEKDVGGKGEEESGVGSKQVEEKTGEEKSVEQDGGDSLRKGGEAGEGL
ncbi:unnamed protein product [Pleuronectes platessa]|uniref:Uncharacterized protein n=1 Tax=Pleuronectes platessa TaxID=8262 RepID=A0A9N7UYZ8_PLEPL|nr:unnamed protein product [Pleuronectes platessa]